MADRADYTGSKNHRRRISRIGKFGPESVQGVVWALGKMKMYGRVSAREMMMLVNQGIPAWQILADEMGNHSKVRNYRKRPYTGRSSN